MSEYQYYEFQTVDRPLSEAEQDEIGSWSSRTTPTSTQAIFTYSYGNFPKSPKKAVEKYFDAMLYISNWGTRRLIFRLPNSSADLELFEPYCFPDAVQVSVANDYLILDICLEDEEGDGWVEGEGWLSSLIMLRNDLLNGDLRMLYLAWLFATSSAYAIEEYLDALEPPVPDNLQNLSAPLKSFVDFFGVDENLLDVASGASATKNANSVIDLKKEIKKLAEEERVDFLLRLAKGEQYLNQRLLKRLHELASPDKIAGQEERPRRTIGDLLAAAEKLADEKEKKRLQRMERERIEKLQRLSGHEDELWQTVFQLIEEKKAGAYDDAISLLLQLRELAEYHERAEQFNARIDGICKSYSRLSGLKYRLDRAGLS